MGATGLKFTRLRVLGFKSFVEPTEFPIEPGLTGVVGPNGCGKSNLVEALRWVMGESSYKAMRASGMDDVIFQGSGNRPARNTAEVSLSVDNGDRLAPAALNDADVLEITRRIEREAGSIYRINGRDVRARDVQLLFADASTGAHSPAIVGQGRIGELIAAKPADRRALLEEAAGISGLHNRRHEAELRLKGAEQNLARLDDVVSEIEQQLDGLKRQARQAVRYRNLSGEIRRAEATVLHLRALAAGEALQEAEATLNETVRIANERASEQAEAAKDQAIAALHVPDLRDAAARAAAAAQRIALAAEALNAEDARIRNRIAELDRRLAQLADDIAREERMVADNGAIITRLDEEERELEAANSAMSARHATAASRGQSAEAAVGDSERQLAELTGQHAEVTAQRGQFERAVREAGERAVRLRQEVDKVRGELAALDRAGGGTTVIERRQAVETTEAGVRAAEAAATAAEHQVQTAREVGGNAREQLTAAEHALSKLETEAATLAAVLAADAPTGHTPVLDSVDVDAGFEAALGAAFGDDLDAATDEAAPARWRQIDGSAQDGALPEGIASLAGHVRAPAVLARRLALTGVVDRADGARLQPLLKPGQRLVSREGDLWRWDGYLAAADAPRAAAQRLKSRNRLAELQAEIQPAKATVEAGQQALQRAGAELAQASDAERQARDALRTARSQLDTARRALTEAEHEENRVAARRGALDEALARLTANLAETEAAEAEARSGLAAAADPAVLTEALARQRETVNEQRGLLAEARAAVQSLAREAEMRSGRLAVIAAERNNWHERAANAATQIATLSARRNEAEAERASLADEPERIEEKRRALLSEASTAEAARAAASDALAKGEAILSEADAVARRALDALAEAREQRGRAEERVVAARQRVTEIAERIAEALNCTPAEIFAETGLKEGAPLPELADVEARLDRYRAERERLGAVNLRAEAEASELTERRDVLTTERDDLIAAIHRLRQGISSLNREGRERLMAAFDTVNNNFKRLFTSLFGGGTAELQLTDSDDPLEAGLEIMVQPPGKKPQVMTLLSGGEQALTALSLIFAVFLTNPAPICVLDEVDAPLDDANVVRFCTLLEEMSRSTDTRFITITHNPITMARMNRLFGVTMAEHGVSQLVSVDLETAESFREAG
jgi:chromosome segregation protein